jgi:hypothetical protein
LTKPEPKAIPPAEDVGPSLDQLLEQIAVLESQKAALSAEVAATTLASQTAIAEAKTLTATATTGIPAPSNSSFEEYVTQHTFTIPAYDSKSMLSPEETTSVITNVMTILKVPNTPENVIKTTATVCVMLQSGATSRKFEENKIFESYGIPMTAKNLKTSLAKVSTSHTPRKLARSLRDQILLVATANGIPGNLSKKFMLENPNHDSSDLIWVSDFQSFTNNPNMPDIVRFWLQKNYSSRFNS